VSASDPQPILVVDDDPKIVALVRAYLERDGFSVITAADGREALASIEQARPRLVVLDVMLPGLDGVALTRLVRQESNIPIVMLSARGTVADRVSGIAEGADDYLPKPFSPAELVVRIHAILRRAAVGASSQGELRHRDLIVDLDRHEVRRNDDTVALTATEFRLLAALVEAAGRVLTREMLLEDLYGQDADEVLDRSIDAYIGRLRDKLGDGPDAPHYIATVRGVGYRITDP
jgi:DNA-binding response OmpR family regulator